MRKILALVAFTLDNPLRDLQGTFENFLSRQPIARFRSNDPPQTRWVSHATRPDVVRDRKHLIDWELQERSEAPRAIFEPADVVVTGQIKASITRKHGERHKPELLS
jgi:hypothetical protein